MKNARDELDPASRHLLATLVNAITLHINFKRYRPAEAILWRLENFASEHGERYQYVDYMWMYLRVDWLEAQGRWNEALESTQAAMKVIGPEDEIYYKFAVGEANLHREMGDARQAVDTIRTVFRSGCEFDLDHEMMTDWVIGFLHGRHRELGEAVLAAEPELREYARRYHVMDDAAIDAAWAEGVEAFLGRFFSKEDDGVVS